MAQLSKHFLRVLHLSSQIGTSTDQLCGYLVIKNMFTTQHEWTTSTMKSTRSLVSGSMTLAQETLTVVTMKATAYALSIPAERNTMSQSICHEKEAKKKESTEELWDIKQPSLPMQPKLQ